MYIRFFPYLCTQKPEDGLRVIKNNCVMERVEITLADGKVIDSSNLYQYNNNILLDSYRAAKERGDEQSAVIILERILDRFKYDSCRKPGETKDELFARQFGDFVNGSLSSPKAVAGKMATEHRYLQNEMFKVCLEYIKVLAENCDRGSYDGRNKYAAETSKKIIDHFKEIDYPF